MSQVALAERPLKLKLSLTAREVLYPSQQPEIQGILKATYLGPTSVRDTSQLRRERFEQDEALAGLREVQIAALAKASRGDQRACILSVIAHPRGGPDALI